MNLNADECVALLGRTTEPFDRVFLLFDALDECPGFDVNNNEWRSKMVSFIDEIRGRTHVFMTSRSHAQLSLELHDCTSLEIWAKDTDIRSYVTARIADHTKLQKMIQKDPNLSEQVANTLCSKAHSM